MRFSKWHALGNSYLVLDRDEVARPLTAEDARSLCDPHRGVGADGAIEVCSRDARGADVVIWNPDGSTAGMSGNGTRIAAAWLLARSGGSDVEVRVGERSVRARRRGSGLIEQELGAVRVSPRETIDVHGNPVELIAVDVGNPHAVLPAERPSREVLLRLGPLVETHHRFPQRTNVQLAHPAGPHDLDVLVWERGAGETAASGSSAVAAAAAALAEGWCSSPVRVHMPGGVLEVELADGRATLVGPAEQVCRGETGETGDAIAWHDLTVPDAGPIRDFYAAVAGWEAEAHDMGGYEDWVMRADGQGVAGICNARGPNEGLPPVWLVYVAVADVAAALERVRALGGEVLREPAAVAGFAVARDPAGAAFALVARRPASG
jgi:diaminopimelate epimerase